MIETLRFGLRQPQVFELFNHVQLHCSIVMNYFIFIEKSVSEKRFEDIAIS